MFRNEATANHSSPARHNSGQPDSNRGVAAQCLIETSKHVGELAGGGDVDFVLGLERGTDLVLEISEDFGV